MRDETLIGELEAVEQAFNQAIVSNDVAQISACISEDWVLVTPEVGPVPRERFLEAVAQGVLSHDTMTKDVDRVRVYGDVAIVTGRGRNTGKFKGQAIGADEWVTDVYVKTSGRWICVLTHLTPVAGA
ncbi:MAG: nuclear transport factor 2 family protein [Ectothiorhodospiraceae bacterium]|nr:nuclear transport factor 2 family protein [Ectothiorhodospiraceae bacterium]MCH8502944.1 nuclear transport factor 2 family protein [Ectothiorhodospiraceae bacterium]